MVRGGEGLASSPPPIHQPRCRDIPAARGRGICADAAGVSSGRDAFGCLGHPAQPTATGMMVRLPSRQDWMLLNRGIQPACTMLLEAVDVAPVKAIPKGCQNGMIQTNAAAMARWADGSSCMYARPTDTRRQIRDRPCPSSVQRHPIVCPGLHDVARMERQQGRSVGSEAAHEKHRGRSRRDHRESNG
jgi:hypothetical protein